MVEITLLFSVCLAVTAFLYSSVGHGGASGYLALMLLFGFPTELMRSTALILNIFISLVAFTHYYKVAGLNKRLFLSLSLLSVPAAFIGGTIQLNSIIYKKIIGVLLIIAVVRILFRYKSDNEKLRPVNYPVALLAGTVIGFVSGLTGIGGGIILSPLLLILSWTTVKEAAALSALFITVNSVAGIAGSSSWSEGIYNGQLLMLITIALAGGTLGSFYGAKHFNASLLKVFLSIVLLIASFKLYFT